jgi:hypothetical protein
LINTSIHPRHITTICPAQLTLTFPCRMGQGDVKDISNRLI